jgi:peptidoglycan hydrolase CwlO-like protein
MAGSSDAGQEHWLQLDVKIDKICNSVDHVKDKQEEMAEDIAKIKEAVYNPDEGLYARLRSLENWKDTSTKLIWTLFTSIAGIISAIIIKVFP